MNDIELMVFAVVALIVGLVYSGNSYNSCNDTEYPHYGLWKPEEKSQKKSKRS